MEAAGKPYRAAPDVMATTYGDTFKLGKLMETARIQLDHHFNVDGVTTRMAGTIIEIEIQYSNLQPFLSSFGGSAVRYIYKIQEKKLPYVSREFLAPVQPADYPNTRTFVIQHGILVVFKVSGQFGFFSIVYLLIMLTTSMALLATAKTLTDVVSIYIHPRRKNYFHLRYDVSPDFSDMWECKVCGFYNHENDTHCQGVDRYCSRQEGPVCGAARDTPAPS
jgi:hypothetical protein